jgi:hypothetical protein
MAGYSSALVAVLAAGVFAGACRGWGAALNDEETKRAEQLVKQLDTADANQRAQAEADLRRLGEGVIPVLSRSQVANEEGHVRLRTTLVDLSVDSSRIDPADANKLMLLGREEALAKRFFLATRCYRRAEKIYDRLKDDADDRKDRAKEREYADLQDKAEKRADKADRLARGEKFTGLNLGIVRVGVEHDNSDQDW